MSAHITRRSFLRNTSIVGLGAPLLHKSLLKNDIVETNKIPVHWLDTEPIGFDFGTTFGIPWSKGTLKNASEIVIESDNGENIAVQSWPLAYWEDGSIKWSAQAIATAKNSALSYTISHSNKTKTTNKQAIIVSDNSNKIHINTGTLTCTFNKSGNILVDSLRNQSGPIAENGQLILLNKEEQSINEYKSKIDNVVIEQKGEIRTIVKITGKHANNTREWLPFTLRFYFYVNSEAIRILHTIVFDGNENKDFITGLGLQFDLPLKEALYNRHVKFADILTNGIFSEAIQNLTGLRRDPGKEARRKQIAGLKVDVSDISEQVQNGLKYIPSWGEYKLTQPLPDAYSITKRTKQNYSWLNAHYGNQSYGVGFVGEPSNGITFGIRNFRASFPTGISLENLHTETGKLKLWLWSPDVESMDLRFYHDGLGEDTYPKQRDALDITYEDYEPGFGSPIGVARTSEIWLKLESEVPSNEKLLNYAKQIQNPLQLVATSEYLHSVAAFGNNWKPQNPNPNHAVLEQHLDFYFQFYKQEIEQRKWYGFWNYGDVMHSYDFDRHNWKYDTGGFAWDNSELSTDLWLWYYFLRTGKQDVFRVAEAMTRHTGEVDVHHIGPFAPLGSRHNVMHWGDSSKQLRISTVTNRRFLYYLTADERIGDLMHEQVYAYKSLQKIAPGRKLPKGSLQQENKDSNYVNLGFGTDWGSIAAAWFTEWERTQDTHWLQLLKNSMQTIAAQPHGFFTGGGSMNIHDGKFLIDTSKKITISHLNAVFGLPEILTEINNAIPIPSFFNAWIDYCSLYNASEDVQKATLGQTLKKLNLQQGHARLTAYASFVKKDKSLLKLAWEKFEEGNGGIKSFQEQILLKVPDVVQDTYEVPNISTNAVAQWSLAAIQCMAYDW